MLTGDTVGARNDVETALRVGGPTFEGERALMLARIVALSRDTAAMNAYRPIVRSYASNTFEGDPSGSVLVVLPALLEYGERETVLRILESWNPRGPALSFWLRWPTFDVLRDDSRFMRVREDSRPK